jgi:hypothetical protein
MRKYGPSAPALPGKRPFRRDSKRKAHAQKTEDKGILKMLVRHILAGAVLLPMTAAWPLAAQDNRDVLLDDEAAKRQIMASPEYREAQAAFREWLSVQQMYDEGQIKELRTELDQRIEGMSASELEEFLLAVREKLNILLSPEAQEARKWAANYMSVLATHKAEEFKKKLPDVVNMTNSELEQYLDTYRRQRQTTRQRQTFSEREQATQVAMANAARKHQEQVYNRSWQQGQATAANQATARASQRANIRRKGLDQKAGQAWRGGSGFRYGYGFRF